MKDLISKLKYVESCPKLPVAEGKTLEVDLRHVQGRLFIAHSDARWLAGTELYKEKMSEHYWTVLKSHDVTYEVLKELTLNKERKLIIIVNSFLSSPTTIAELLAIPLIFYSDFRLTLSAVRREEQNILLAMGSAIAELKDAPWFMEYSPFADSISKPFNNIYDALESTSNHVVITIDNNGGIIKELRSIDNTYYVTPGLGIEPTKDMTDYQERILVMDANKIKLG